MATTSIPPDDVSALMTRVELDHSQYKVFDRRLGSQIESGTKSLLADAQASARSHSHGSRSMTESPSQVSESSRPRWSVLNSLLSPGQDSIAEVPEQLLVPMLTLTAGSGGVGKTTILGSLARILSGMGESLMLVFSDSQRTLPLYFGGQQLVPGRVRTFIPPVRNSGELHLYARSLAQGEIPEDIGNWLPRQVNVLAAEVGRVLCEVSRSEVSERQALELASINLRVIVPDISSVLTVNRDLDDLGNRGDDQTFYLLNKYDSTLTFHRNVRERLSMTLGKRLLPFAIRRTDQIPESLAAGVTVSDYAPGSGVVEDFEKVAHWLCKSMQRNEINPPRPIL